ncbi:MFS transporter [soil metagenome]
MATNREEAAGAAIGSDEEGNLLADPGSVKDAAQLTSKAEDDTGPKPKQRPPPLTWRQRLIPVIVASPLFLQNLDTSVMATALPSIAQSLDVEPLHLNLAITSYLLSLAVFLPISGWCAERFGPRRVFCFAIACFSVGSALCGLSNSLGSLVAFRVIQGIGGAMMVPVGRLILLSSVSAAHMVAAMVWFTVPPTVGRMVGPLFGGAIVTWTSWRWIFLVNIPFGVLSIVLALRFIDEQPRDPLTRQARFDIVGFVLLAIALSGLLGALELTGKSLVAAWITALVGAVGIAASWFYYLRSRDHSNPIIDLKILRYSAFRASVVGGMPLRIAIGASPFLLPLMLQLGFGLSPLASGSITVASAIGALATRGLMSRVIRRFEFRTILVSATVLTSICYASYGLFTPNTPHALMFCTLMVGGLVNSMGMVSLTTLGFSSIPKRGMSHATTLSSMAQQLSVSFGVVLGATLVGLTAWLHSGDSTHLTARDFSPTFFAIGMITMLSLVWFLKLDEHEGDELR